MIVENDIIYANFDFIIISKVLIKIIQIIANVSFQVTLLIIYYI